jgi:hypothetical protein
VEEAEEAVLDTQGHLVHLQATQVETLHLDHSRPLTAVLEAKEEKVEVVLTLVIQAQAELKLDLS